LILADWRKSDNVMSSLFLNSLIMKRFSIFLLSGLMLSTLFIMPLRADESVMTTANVPFTDEEIECMQDAISVRDEALAEAYDTYSAAVKAALSTRTGALIEAWGMGNTEEVKTALAVAWQTYRRSHVQARIALRRVKVSAWKEFNTTRAACLGVDAASDASSVKSDAQL
jgi:hypothetical protein